MSYKYSLYEIVRPKLYPRQQKAVERIIKENELIKTMKEYGDECDEESVRECLRKIS